MAMLFEDDRRTLECSCGDRRMYKKEIFSYQKHERGDVIETLISTEIRCEKCTSVVKVITPNRGDRILT